MALYALGDPHLSLGSDKPMDVFGGNWDNYIEKLREGLSILESSDLCVLCGDISWAMTLEEALADFAFLNSFPGRKLILKGNHDYWWDTVSKLQGFFSKNGLDTLGILHNNCHEYDGIAICGTRGWFYEEESGDSHDRKILNRELIRLETSLKAAGEREKLCFFHYPPLYKGYECREIIGLLKRYGVRHVYYGHIHSAGHKHAIEGWISGIEYRMVSADWIGFRPYRVDLQ